MPTLTDVDIWPLLGFRITVSDVELAAVDDRTALELGRLAASGIHGNALPFTTPWSRGSDVEVARNVFRHHRLDRAAWERRPAELRPHVLMEGLGPVRTWLGLD